MYFILFSQNGISVRFLVWLREVYAEIIYTSMDFQNNRNIPIHVRRNLLHFTIQAKYTVHIIQGKSWNYDFDAQAHSTLLLVLASIIIRNGTQSYNNRNEIKWCCKAPPVTFNIHKMWIISSSLVKLCYIIVMYIQIGIF